MPRFPRASSLLSLVATAILAGAVAIVRPGPLPALDWLVYDGLVRSVAGNGGDRGTTAIVAIDEGSLASRGQWPWSREVVAELLDRLHEMGATATAFDMLFAEADRIQPASDARLAASLARAPTVLGHGLLFDVVAAPPGCHLRPVELIERQLGDVPPHSRFFDARGAICPLPELAAAAGSTGFINAAPDADGRLRRVPLLVRHGDDVYQSLPLAAVRRVTGNGPLVLNARGDGSLALTVGGRSVTLDAAGRMLVRHEPAARASIIPASDVLDGRVDPVNVRDRIVFIGATALGLRDVVSTPTEQSLPGVVLHASVADTLLGAPGFERPELAPLIEVTSAIGLAMWVTLTGRRVGWIAAAASGAVLGVAIWWAARELLGREGAFISPSWGWLAIAGALAVEGATGVVRERRRAERERRRRGDAQRLIVQALTTLTETRDADTGRHARRTQELTRILATSLARRPAYRKALDSGRLSLVATLAPLHDIGKVGVSDAVLRKPGALTPEEVEEMRRHPELGYASLLRAEELAGVHDDEVLAVAKEIVHTHHERWDGSGYPRGLRGESIPVSGRIVALVDAYDAMVGGRTYRASVAHEEAVRAITAESGGHFDPAVVAAFLSVQEQFRAFQDH
jgi:CHASE2 domain-containing sensor protein